MSDLVETLVTALQEQAARQRGFLSDTMARALAQVAINTIRESTSRGSAASVPALASGEDGSWQATGELRWYAEQMNTPVQLQQAWRRAGDGQLQWRPVPLAVEGNPKTGDAA